MNVENACLLTGNTKAERERLIVYPRRPSSYPSSDHRPYTPTRSLSECDNVKSNVKQGVKARLVKCDEWGKRKTICRGFNHGLELAIIDSRKARRTWKSKKYC